MSCEQCSSPCRGRLCQACEQIQTNEKLHGSSAGDGSSTWDVRQQALGDREPEGQSTLDGGIVPEGGSDDA